MIKINSQICNKVGNEILGLNALIAIIFGIVYSWQTFLSISGYEELHKADFLVIPFLFILYLGFLIYACRYKLNKILKKDIKNKVTNSEIVVLCLLSILFFIVGCLISTLLSATMYYIYDNYFHTIFTHYGYLLHKIMFLTGLSQNFISLFLSFSFMFMMIITICLPPLLSLYFSYHISYRYGAYLKSKSIES